MSVERSEPINQTEKSPLISLIVGGRNDSYMGDFKWRFSAAINFLCQSLKEIGRIGDLELVVCDWGSEVPLHKVLTLCPEAKDVVRFVVVPPEVAKSVMDAKECTFPIPIVQNIVIRRSRGQFIGQTDSDVLYTTSTLLSLFAALEGKVPHVPFDKAFLTGGRRHMPLPQILSQPSYVQLRDYVLRNGFLLNPEIPQAGSAAPTSLVMMHRDLWFEMNGYDEKWVHWGWMDLDLALRATQRYPIVHLDNFGLNLIHLEHYAVRDYDPKKHFRRTNRSDDNPVYVANDERWGLADHDFQICEVENVDAQLCAEARPSGLSRTDWNISPQQISAELATPDLHKHIQEILQAVKVPIQAEEGPALTLLGWAAARIKPRVFVESGMRYAHAACLVSRMSPGVEYYGLVNWQRPGPDEHLFAGRDDACLTFWASNVLLNVGNHKSYSRFVGGEPETAFKRLVDSSPAQFEVDLALVRAWEFGNIQAKQIIGSLSKGGVMIFSAKNPFEFSSQWQTFQNQFPSHIMIMGADGCNGIIVNQK